VFALQNYSILKQIADVVTAGLQRVNFIHLPHLDILLYEVHVLVMKMAAFNILRKSETAKEN
jgi:hypothetical protein